MTSAKRGSKIRGVAREVVVVSPQRRARSYGVQLAAGVRIITLGNDVTRLVFHLLPFRSRIACSHVCAYWRSLAVSDPLLWTVLNGHRALLPVLWARAGLGTGIDVRLDMRESSVEDIVSCISNDINRMTSITVVARPHRGDIPIAAWQTVVNTLSRPAPRMRHLHLVAPLLSHLDTDASFSLAALGPACHLRELTLFRTEVLDFTALPTRLTSFAYGDPGHIGSAYLTFQDLQIILQTCLELKILWLSVLMDLTHAEFGITPPPRLQLKDLSLGWTASSVTQRLLDFLSFRNMQHIDVGDMYDDPVHGVLQDFVGHAMSILPPTISGEEDGYTNCDLLVSDSRGRSRRVRGVNATQTVQYATLWSHLVSLTLPSHWDDWDSIPIRPPPDMPDLKSLHILYQPLPGLSKDIKTMGLWGPSFPSWRCPSVHTIEFAPAVYPSKHYHAPTQRLAQHIAIHPRHVRKFVTRELPSARVSRVVFKGEGIHLKSEIDETLSFSLSCDGCDRTVHVFEHKLVFNGFKSEQSSA